MIDTIQRSLLADLKQNPTFQASVPRKVYDELYKIVMHSTVTQRTELYKSLNACLIGQDDPVFELPSGSSISLSGKPELVRVLRQTLGFFSRLNSNVDEQTRLRQLEETKLRVSRAPSFNVSPEDREQMCRFIEYILGPCPHPDTWPMKHGPGAVAEGNKAAKGEFTRIPRKLVQFADKHYSVTTSERMGPDGVVSWVFDPWDSMRWFQMPHAPRRCPEWEAPTTRVVTVPKDATKVRIISCEPAASQFVQQGLMGIMYDRLSKYETVCPLDQSRNRELARKGSLDHSVATLDCSNASDEVRWLHVQKLFPPDWVSAFDSIRSENMKFPDGEEVKITTFAPMGSALCFPVELIVFAAIGFAAWCRFGTIHPLEYLSHSSIGHFGDDTVIPDWLVEDYYDICDGLDIPINRLKSCVHGAHFRESCGLDCFEGSDVSIIRPRAIGKSRKCAAPMVLHANRLLATGFRMTAQCMANFVSVPVSLGYGPGLADPSLRWNKLGQVRYNRALMRWEGQIPRNRIKTVPPLQGWVGLHTWFTSQRQSDSPFTNEDLAVPTIAWSEIDANMAFEQMTRSHRDALMANGQKPYARGTPVGGDSEPTTTQIREDHKSHLVEWCDELRQLGFQVDMNSDGSLTFYPKG